MKTFERCLVATSALILSFGYLASVLEINIGFIIGFIALLIISTYILAPVGSEEKPITDKVYEQSLRVKSVQVVIAFSIVALGLVVLGYKSMGIAVLLGIVLELFTLTKFCFRVFGLIENKLDSIIGKQ